MRLALREPAGRRLRRRRDGDLAALQPRGAAGDDRHGLRGADDDGARAGRARALRRRGRPLQRREVRLGRLDARLARPPALLPGGRPLHRRRAAAARSSTSIQLRWHLPVGRTTLAPGRRRDAPVLRGLRGVRAARGALRYQGAALPLHRGDAVRPGDAGQGHRRARPARARFPRVPRLHLELEAPPARPAALRRALALLRWPSWPCPGTRRCWSSTASRSGTSSTATTTGAGSMVGRHGDRGTFEYFLRELGYAALPWIALAPAALAYAVMRPRDDAGPREARARASTGSAPSGSSRPTRSCRCRSRSSTTTSCRRCPGLAIAIGCFLDELLSAADARPRRRRPSWAFRCSRWSWSTWRSSPRTRSTSSGCSRTTTSTRPRGAPGRPALDFRATLIVFAVAVRARPRAALAWRRIQRGAAIALCLLAVAFTYFLLDGYMMKVTPYWTQKGLIASYYKMRRSPDEHLLVWQMYWRGENFYTQNEIYEGPADERTIFLGDKNVENLKAWMGRHRGHRAFFLDRALADEPARGHRPARDQEEPQDRRREQHEVLPRRRSSSDGWRQRSAVPACDHSRPPGWACCVRSLTAGPSGRIRPPRGSNPGIPRAQSPHHIQRKRQSRARAGDLPLRRNAARPRRGDALRGR